MPEMANDCPPLPLQASKTILRGWPGIERHAREKLDTSCVFFCSQWLNRFTSILEVYIEPERVILHKLLSHFGPLSDALVKHVNDEKAGELLKNLWKMIEENEEQAEGHEPFEQWTEADYPNLNGDAERLIMVMTNLDHGKRAEMTDTMTDPFWDGVGSEGIFALKDVLKIMQMNCLI
ncbi:hypothetical protein ACHAPC_006312 [Botrytis cinerea]